MFEGIDVPLFFGGGGDSAYPLLTWLMKPYPEGGGVTPQQLNFNHRLSQACMTVERAFGRLKGCWHCLLKESEAHICQSHSVCLLCASQLL